MSQVAESREERIDNSRRNHDGGCRTHPRRGPAHATTRITPLSDRADLDLRRQPRHEGSLLRFVLHSGHLAVDKNSLARFDAGLVERLERSKAHDLAAEAQLADVERIPIIGHGGDAGRRRLGVGDVSGRFRRRAAQSRSATMLGFDCVSAPIR